MDAAIVQAIDAGFSGIAGILLFWACGSMFFAALGIYLVQKD